MRSKKVFMAAVIGLAAVGLALIVVCVLWPSRHLETDRLAVDWQTTGRPMEVSGVVVDDQGRPVPGLAIHVEGDFLGQVADDYYGGEDATTDAQGRFAVKFGVPKVDGLRVGNAGRIAWKEGPFFSQLDCSNGLQFHIRLKSKP